MSKEKKIYNFCGRKKLVGIIAAVFVLAAIIGTLILKIDVAIEFKGGTIITYTYDGDIDTNSVQKTISDSLGLKVKVGAGESLSTGEKNLLIQGDQGKSRFGNADNLRQVADKTGQMPATVERGLDSRQHIFPFVAPVLLENIGDNIQRGTDRPDRIIHLVRHHTDDAFV